MKKVLFLLLFSTNAFAQIYTCGRLEGINSNGDLDHTTAEKCHYITLKEQMTVKCENDPINYNSECIVIENDKDKIVSFCHGSIASGVYLIDKKKEIIRYSKVGIINGQSYASFFSGKCEKVE